MAREYPDALPVGYRLEEYEIVRVLGQGGFAITYLAKDNYRDQEVALKEYFLDGYAMRTGATRVGPAPGARKDFDWGYERFLEEARILQKFRHPNIPAAYRYLRANGTAYIAMEFIEGRSLSGRLGPHGSLPLPLGEWRPWLDRLLDALEHVHGHDYLHRDITPSNILIRGTDDQPVLIDFGAARIATEERTRNVLTKAYAPPEQHSERAKQNPFTDIYSMAAVSYRVLTGDLPASAMDRAAGEEHQPLAQRFEETADWMATVDRALALRPKKRPQTVGAWRRELNEAAASLWLQGEPAAARDTEGLTALHRAAAEEPLPEVIALLLDDGADIGDRNEAGETPLHRAARKNAHMDVLTVLLDRGADINARDGNGNTPLHAAARHNRNPTALKVLLDRGTDVNVRNDADATPLHVAACEDAFGVAEFLVGNGVWIGARDRAGRTALHVAAGRNSMQLSQLLLNNGADIEARVPIDTRDWNSRLNLGRAVGDKLEARWWLAFDSYDVTKQVPISIHDPDWALWYLTLDNHFDVSGWAEAAPLHMAAQNDARSVARLLLDRGADPTARDSTGRTPLHLAALNNAIATAELLIRSSADVGPEDAAGRTPLHFAAWGNSRQVAELLLRHGAELQPSEPVRSRHWTWKVGIGARDVVALLLRREFGGICDSSRTNDQLSENGWANLRPVAEMLLSKGNTPLHWAAFGDSREVAELLLDEGADVHGSKSEGPTPLDFAALGNATGAAQLLLDRGADARPRDDYPATPLHWAALGNACETIALLIDRGTGTGARRPRWTPMLFAALGNAREAMELLLAHGATIGPHNTSGTILRSWGDWRERRESFPAHDTESRTDTLLHWASVRDAADVVEFLLDRGLDLETEDAEGWTPLDYAAQGDAVRAAQRLLDRGADSGGSRRVDATPLHSAACSGATGNVRLLVERGADLGARDSDGRTPLHVAASSNSIEAARALIDAGADIDDRSRTDTYRPTDDGETPLHCAAERDAVEIAKLLLEEGADVEARTEECWTPLHMAASEGAHAVAELLLDRNAGIHSETREGKTPLHLALESMPGAHRCWRQAPEGDKHHLALVELLLGRGANIHAVDTDGRTPLNYVMSQPSPEAVEFLLASGVAMTAVLNSAVRQLTRSAYRASLRSGINTSEAGSSTQTLESACSDAREVVESLLKRGADIDALDTDGVAPIHVAAGWGVQSAAAFLLDHGADIHCRDGNGDTPLHHAAEGDSASLIQLLLSRGASIRATNATGKTSLHLTGRTDAYTAAQALLRAGGDADARDKTGRTPLHDAAYGFSPSVSRELLKHGAALDARDSKGNTPLHDAIRGDAWELVEMLVTRGADPKPLDDYNQGWAEEGAAVEERLSWAKAGRVHRLVSALRNALCMVLQRVADKRGWHEADREFRAIEERLSDAGVFPRVFNYPLDERNIDLSVEELVSEKDGETLYWYLENNLDVEQTQEVVSALRNNASLDLYRWREMLCL
ncbi:MAG: ankyrin repeat domain-containing protein [Rhodospirillales bacterium]|nr:ankyrin repeat domain-containing protein [Rhodospirillales bacterium]